MEKIKIAFDPQNDDDKDVNIWINDGGFREIIRILELNNDNDVYIVTTCPNTEFIDNIASYLKLDAEHVYYCADNETVLNILTKLEISIYLTPIIEMFEIGNADTNVLATIFCDTKLDSYNAQKKYFSMLEFWLGRRLNNRKSE